MAIRANLACRAGLATNVFAAIRAAIWVTALLLVAGCGDNIGAACEITGSGFTAKHNCRVKCLYYNDVQCPDGSTLKPQMCSGASNCNPGSCPDGQICYSYDDPFEKESYCVPATLCGEQTDAALAAWERESRRRADATREAMEQRMQRRRLNTTPAGTADSEAKTPTPSQ